MGVQTESLSVENHSRFEILSVTLKAETTIEDLGMADGLVYVSTPHTSAALSTNKYRERLLDDMIDKFKQITSPDDGYYRDLDHIVAGEQSNAHAHLISTMIKRPILLVLRDEELDLGTWEEAMFFELCGPRERAITTMILR